MRRLLFALALLALSAGDARAQLERSVTLAPQPIKGAIELQLESAKSARERAALKAASLAAVGKVAAFTKTKRARTFEIELREAPVVEDGVLVVYARAKVGGEAVGLGVRRVEWERLRFVNPPVKVPTGTYREEVVGGETVLVENAREDAGAALREIIADAIGVIAKTGPPRVRGSVGRTTTTIYSGAADGRIYRGAVDEDWATIVAGAGSTYNSGSTGQFCAGPRASSTTDQFAYLIRCFLPFDLSAVSGRVESAGVTIEPTSQEPINLGASDWHYVLATPAVDGAIEVADFTAVGDTSFGSFHNDDISLGVPHDVALNAAGVAAVQGAAGGWLTLSILSGWDLTGTFSGTWSSGDETYLVIKISETAGGVTDHPHLVVEHFAGGPGPQVGAPF